MVGFLRFMLLIVRWLLGTFFILITLTELVMYNNGYTAFISALGVLFLLPPMYNAFGTFLVRYTSFNIFRLPLGFKFIIILALIFWYGIVDSAQTALHRQSLERFSITAPSPTINPSSESVLSAPLVSATASPSASPQFYSVVKVIDGDTLQVKIDTAVQTIRLIGVDTPETVDPRKSVQCFGKEASNKAKELMTGKQVSLELDSTQGNTDKYNRLLRYVYLEDGTLVNKYLIREGYGFEYTYQSNPYNYQLDFKNAQKYAEENKKGLWADGACATASSTALPKSFVPSTPIPVTQKSTGSVGGYSCAGKTKCGEMTTCAEAQYYLTTCGVSRLDGDSDGVPCESLCN